MCGIVGSFSFKGPYQDTGVLSAAIAKLKHRGPNDEGKFVSGPVGLGHRRLSIIDTSEAGKQPFTDETGRYTIVFNGEIYNYKELRKALLARGHQFRSATDTEVLLKGFMEFGPAILQKLNGFFAFAIHDAEDGSLFLARDRFGIKPLYWSKDDNHFHFASELKALMALGISKELDKNSLAMYLQLSYIPAPWTIFKSSQKLKPGYQIMVKEGDVNMERYYDPRTAINDVTIPGSDPEAELRVLLDRSVERRLISDVPLGSFLSGGVDSSIIASIASEKVKGFKTFSIGFPDHPKYDETKYAEKVAEHIGSDHTTFAMREDDLKAEFFTVIDHLDEPFADSSAIPVHLLSSRTKEHVTVALSGDGADEVFSGYNKHLAEYRIRKGGILVAAIKMFGPLWNTLKGSRASKSGDLFRKLDRFAKGARLSDFERYWMWASFTEHKKALSLIAARPEEEVLEYRFQDTMAYADPNDLQKLLLNDIMNVLPNDMLKKVDSMSMAHGLEVRTPFLDHEVVEFANSLPAGNKFGRGELKSILRSAYKDKLPSAVFNRPKRGFEVPLLKWCRGDMHEKIEQLLDPEELSSQGMLNTTSVEALLRNLKNNNVGDIQATIYSLIVFQLWWNINVENS